MKTMKQRTCLLTAASALALAMSANAGFVNGGFETGDFTGWTLEHGTNLGGPATITWSSGSAGHAYIVGPGAQLPSRDPYSSFDTAFNGDYMAQLNEFVPPGGAGLAHATRISQTGTMGALETDVYINWGAAMEDPNHPANQQPFFQIEVYKNGGLFDSLFKVADPGPGWTLSGAGPDGASTYYSSGQYHLAGLTAGDTVRVVMTVADCSPTGHAGWAYLDGIGTAPAPFPDSGSTLALLGLTLGGIGALRRKLKLA